jgi:hypothetical protein
MCWEYNELNNSSSNNNNNNPFTKRNSSKSYSKVGYYLLENTSLFMTYINAGIVEKKILVSEKKTKPVSKL